MKINVSTPVNSFAITDLQKMKHIQMKIARNQLSRRKLTIGKKISLNTAQVKPLQTNSSIMVKRIDIRV